VKTAGEKVAGERWPSRGAFAAATLLALAAIAVAVASVSSARPAARATITGTPVVGETLVSSESNLYRWQRCDPAVATCVDAAANDSNWSDIGGARARTYTVLPDDVGFFIRVLTKGTSLGEQWGGSAPVGPVTGEPPLHGIRVVAEPVEGTVKVREPGEKAFSVLTELSLIPVGSSIDTRGSRVRLTAATGGFGSEALDHPIDFYAGLIKVTQKPAMNAPAVAKLIHKLRCGTKKSAKNATASAGGPKAVVSRHRRRHRVWGSGSGSYSTAGSGGTGSVRGTTWLTKDTCKGTKFRVTEGLGITVFDKKKKKKIKLGPGDTYFAAK
jgi:hypothetical protein